MSSTSHAGAGSPRHAIRNRRAIRTICNNPTKKQPTNHAGSSTPSRTSGRHHGSAVGAGEGGVGAGGGEGRAGEGAAAAGGHLSVETLGGVFTFGAGSLTTTTGTGAFSAGDVAKDVLTSGNCHGHVSQIGLRSFRSTTSHRACRTAGRSRPNQQASRTTPARAPDVTALCANHQSIGPPLRIGGAKGTPVTSWATEGPAGRAACETGRSLRG